VFRALNLAMQEISDHDSMLTYTLSCYGIKTKKTKFRGLWSASELYRPSDRRMSAKLVPTFAGRGCRVVSATDPYGR
jgi:hypothetical protein